MCGICGYIDKNNEIYDNNTIEKMSELISHRGPDDQGTELLDVYGNRNIAVAHNRLSIRDISSNGHQPMFNTKGSICIAYNGEIYNVEKYRRELISMGISFKGTSDTEVILYLYQQYGIEEMLEKLDGMFAIFIADTCKRKVYLVRDRVGVKPMYYYQTSSVFMFSSEIKSFYAHPEFINEINDSAITEYFLFRYVAGTETLLKNVFTLLPGHYLEINSDYDVKDVVYWDITSIKKVKGQKYCDIERIIKKSIKDRLASDVKVGVQLSGGVDSSVVTANVVDEIGDESLEAFSIVFKDYNINDGDLSEKKWIDQVISNERITSNQYPLSGEDFYNMFSSAIWHLDTPMSIPNSVGIFYLCKRAYEKGVKVLLTGEGADEIMGGYWRYSKFLYALKHPIAQHLFDKILKRQNIKFRDLDERIILSSAWISRKEIDRIIANPKADEVYKKRKAILDGINCDSIIEKYLNYDVYTYMQDILNRQDKMSMAASVETRVPFLGKEVITAIRQQKTKKYVKAGYFSWTVAQNTKIPLKKISENRFGRRFTYRNKNGFGLPMRDYLMNDNMSLHVENSIFPYLRKQGIVNMDIIQEKWKNREHCSYKDISDLWIAISFGEWSMIFLEDKSVVTGFGKVG